MPADRHVTQELALQWINQGKRQIDEEDLNGLVRASQVLSQSLQISPLAILVWMTAGLTVAGVRELIESKIPVAEHPPDWARELIADITGEAPEDLTGPVRNEQDLRRRAQRAGIILGR